jgi:hypothetical protein
MSNRVESASIAHWTFITVDKDFQFELSHLYIFGSFFLCQEIDS